MRAQPGSVLLHHDLRGIAEGFVLRRQKYGDRQEVAYLRLEHGCVSCTLREDLLPLVAKLAGNPESPGSWSISTPQWSLSRSAGVVVAGPRSGRGHGRDWRPG